MSLGDTLGNNGEQSTPVRTDNHVLQNALPAVGGRLPPGPRRDAVSQVCSPQGLERVPGLPRASADRSGLASLSAGVERMVGCARAGTLPGRPRTHVRKGFPCH